MGHHSKAIAQREFGLVNLLKCIYIGETKTQNVCLQCEECIEGKETHFSFVEIKCREGIYKYMCTVLQNNSFKPWISAYHLPSQPP